MKLVITLMLLCLPVLGLYAQEAPGLRGIIVDSANYVPVQRYRAYGLSYKSLRDRALSPLLFQGYGFSFSSSSWKYDRQWLWQSAFITQINPLENAAGSSQMVDLAYSYEISALRELTKWQKGPWRFWAGPEFRMLLNTRLLATNVNNVASYDWATSLGVSAMLSRRFKLWNRTFAFSNQFQLPLGFVYARPAYAWGVPPAIYEEQRGSWREAFQLGTLNDILLMNNQMNLDFYLRKGKKKAVREYQAYRVSYSWNFFQITTLNSLQTGGHLLSFSRVITF